MSLLTFATAPHDELLLIIRRMADVFLASVLLVLFSPVFLVVGVAVKLSSRGPALFPPDTVRPERSAVRLPEVPVHGP